jgi:DNA-binding beta-propeller fold protein YncE
MEVRTRQIIRGFHFRWRLDMRRIYCIATLFLAFCIFSSARVPAAEGPYHFITKIDLGGEGGWDYASVDAAARRLYVTHATMVFVIDLDTNAVVGKITDTPGVHGFAVAADLGLGFASNGRENTASIVDLKTLETKMKVETGANPDAILYVPGVQEVYTFNGFGKSATVFSAKTGEVITTIPLPGKPEFAQVDLKAGRIYNNIEDTSEVVVIDIKTHEIVAKWPIAPGEEASGMAIDLANHRLFIGASNNLMVVMDSTTGKVVATVPIGPGVDANRFDPATKLAFASSGGDGTVTIAHEDSPDKITVVQKLETQRGSRTMTLDPGTHNIYLAAIDYEASEEAPAQSGPGRRFARPKPVPNSFKVLVYGTETK